MRIALVIRNFAGLVGGAERAVASLAGALVERGCETWIFTHDKQAGPPHYPVDPRAPIVNLHPNPLQTGPPERAAAERPKAPRKRFAKRIVARSRALRDLASARRHGAAAKRLADALASFAPDVVCAFMPNAIAPTRHALERLGDRAPASVAALRITPEFDFPVRSLDDGAALKAQIHLDALDRFDRIAVQWASYVERLPEGLHERCRPIANEIDLARFSETRAPALLERARVVAFVGRLIADKRPELAIEAFRDRAPADWRMRVLGVGPAEDRLRALADERIAFEGVRRDVETVYFDAQIIAAPSLYEGFPRALSEGMAAGLAPIAIADCEGAANLLAAALIEPAPSPGAFADALERAMRDADWRAEAGRKAARAAKAFAPEPIFDQWLALFDEAARSR